MVAPANPITKFPLYLIETNLVGTTNAWLLGISTLGHGTVLRTNPVTGATLAALPGGRFMGAQIQRGRTDELGQVATGTMTLTLSNSDGAFSPDNAASPYYGSLVPERQIRLSARYGATAPWQPLFTGYIESIRPVDNGPADSNAVLTCHDWLGRAAGADLTANRGAETDRARFAALAADAGVDLWPTAVIGPAGTAETVAAKNYAGVKGLEALQELADTTRGMIFAAVDGTITYWTRFGRWTAPGAFATGGYRFDQVGFDASATVCPYSELDYDFDYKNLNNDVTVIGSDGAPQNAQDATSLTRYGKKSLPLSLALLDPTRSSGLAQYLLAGYKDPYPRVHGITVDGDAWANRGQTPLWDTLYGIELNHTVRVVKRQPGNVSIDRTMFVEGVRHDIAVGESDMHHTITLQLSDRRQAGVQPWVLSQCQLGIATFLSY